MAPSRQQPSSRAVLGALPNAPNHPPPTMTSAMPISSILVGPPGLSQENRAPLPLAKPAAKPAAATKTNSKKRKSVDQVPDDFDPDNMSVDHLPMTENCDQVRRKINRFLDSGAMTKTAFAREIGVSAKSLSGFLGEHGAHKGSGFAAYGAAWEYFKKREVAGVKFPKKQKTDPVPAASVEGATDAAPAAKSAKKVTKTAPGMNSAGVDISDIHLGGEQTDSVPVYESCDEIRRKINAHLKKPGVTQAQFCRDMLAQLQSAGRPANIQSTQLSRFRGMKGPTAGCTSVVFYAAYVFFEKVRIKEGKPKSKHRTEMERQWGNKGIDREHDGRGGLWCRAGERPHVDQYGKYSFY